MGLYFTGRARWWARAAALVFTTGALILPPFGVAWAETDAYGTSYLPGYGPSGGGTVTTVNFGDGVTSFNLDKPPAGYGIGTEQGNYTFNPKTGTYENTIGTGEGTQAYGQIYGGGAEGSGGGPYDLADAAGGFAECVFGEALANLIAFFITHLIETMIAETVESLIELLFQVPVGDLKQRQNSSTQRAKEVCSLQIFGICLLPSLDAVFYCLVNGVIEYIGQATVRWINSGFEGNPAFVDDPGQFYKDASDIVAGEFISGISEGLLCEAYKVPIQLRLLREYQNSSGGGSSALNSSCRLSGVTDPEKFFNGDSGGNLEAFRAAAIDDNYYEKQFIASDALWSGINAQRDSLQEQLQWSSGYLSKKDSETGRITTPGRTIEGLINQRLFNGERRLILADSFDNIVAALANAIKVALHEVLQEALN